MTGSAVPAAPSGTTASECRRVVGAVYRAIDAGRATATVASYTDDSVLVTARGSAVGTAEITALMAAREAETTRVTRHVLEDVTVTATGATEAELIATLSVYVPDSQDAEHVSSLRVRLSRGDDGWRILRQESVRLAAPMVPPSGEGRP